MITVVTENNTASANNSCDFNSKKFSSTINCINLNGAITRKKHQIKFEDQVKRFYYDLDQPILKPRQHFLKQKIPIIKCDNIHNLCKLESFKMTNYPKVSLPDLIQTEGHVVVKNMSFEKRITIRYTLTEWKSFSDVDAFFVNSLDLFSDRFMFTIKIHKSLVENAAQSMKISFAIKYEFRDQVYWDNNSGNNYEFLLHY